MVDALHDVPLVHNDVFLFVFDDHLLINNLHRAETSITFISA